MERVLRRALHLDSRQAPPVAEGEVGLNVYLLSRNSAFEPLDWNVCFGSLFLHAPTRCI